MPELPSGTITMLFTDIVGSTRLLQRLGDGYQPVIADHHRLLRDALRDRGHEVEDRGDGIFAVFARAADALAAAVAAQRAIVAHPWPEGGAVQVRIGLHSGDPALVGANYVGLDVHRAARLCDAAHGGQVLLSAAARELVEQHLPDDVTLRDLGEHHLRDLQRPERIFQAVIAGLPTDFPPPRTVNRRPNNLPVARAAIIGRAERAARLRGAVTALHEATGRRTSAWVREEGEAETALLREALGDAGFEVAWNEGRALSLDQAVRYALEEIDEDPGGPRSWPS